jgi:hypothetical protein
LPLALATLAYWGFLTHPAQAAPKLHCTAPGYASQLRTVGVTCPHARNLLGRLFGDTDANETPFGTKRHFIVSGKAGEGSSLRPYRCSVIYTKDHGANRGGILLRARCRDAKGHKVNLTDHQDNE